MRILAGILIAATALAASAGGVDAPLPGLHVRVARPIVPRGSVVSARVLWETGGSFRVTGRFTARWQLRASDGTVVAHGRRPVRIGGDEDPPYRFRVRARVPRSVHWDILDLEVGLVDDASPDEEASEWARGVASVAVEPGRAFFGDGAERTTWTGVLRSGGGRPALELEDVPWAGRLGLQGPGESSIRANPAWEGARVAVTGRNFQGTCCAYFPEDPGSLWVEGVEWLDPLPEDLGFGGEAHGVVPARLPPPEVLGEVNWARFVRESRAPVVVETAEELAALREDLGPTVGGRPDPLGVFDGVDFSARRVVVVFAGVSPSPSWAVRIGAFSYDPVGGRTLVRYSVIAPSRDAASNLRWSEPFAAFAIERRDGPVEFQRQEWIPRLPSWW